MLLRAVMLLTFNMYGLARIDDPILPSNISDSGFCYLHCSPHVSICVVVTCLSPQYPQSAYIALGMFYYFMCAFLLYLMLVTIAVRPIVSKCMLTLGTIFMHIPALCHHCLQPTNVAGRFVFVYWFGYEFCLFHVACFVGPINCFFLFYIDAHPRIPTRHLHASRGRGQWRWRLHVAFF